MEGGGWVAAEVPAPNILRCWGEARAFGLEEVGAVKGAFRQWTERQTLLPKMTF
jgi:hypothetical protein